MTPRRALLLFLLLLSGWTAVRQDVMRHDITRFRAAVAVARTAAGTNVPPDPDVLSSDATVAADAARPPDAGARAAMSALMDRSSGPVVPLSIAGAATPRSGPAALHAAWPKVSPTGAVVPLTFAAAPARPPSSAAGGPARHAFAGRTGANRDPERDRRAYGLAEQGYAALARQDRRAAAAAFAQALRLASPQQPQRPAWQAEQDRLMDRWRLAAYGFWRSGQPAAFDPAASGHALGGSQSALQVSYRPDPLARRPVDIEGRLIIAHHRTPPRPRPDTAQATLGLSWAPLPAVSGALVAERWFKLGDDARNAWALRGWVGRGDGYGPPPGSRTWTHWSFYAEAAVIGTQRRDLFGAAEAHIGQGVALGDSARLTLVGSLWGMAQHDDHDTRRLEAGPGLWWQGTLADVPVDARLDYRRRLAGNTDGGSGLTATIGLSF